MKWYNIIGFILFIIIMGVVSQPSTASATDNYCCSGLSDGNPTCSILGSGLTPGPACPEGFSTFADQDSIEAAMRAYNPAASRAFCCCSGAGTGSSCRSLSDQYGLCVDNEVRIDADNQIACTVQYVNSYPNGPPTGAGSTGSGAGGQAYVPTTTLVNPLTGNAGPIDVNALFANIVKAFLGLAGALALVFTILGGVKWMTSGGNAEKIQSGRDTLMWAALGLMVVLFSYVILNFLLTALK